MKAEVEGDQIGEQRKNQLVSATKERKAEVKAS
jgi:hypothetical protein